MPFAPTLSISTLFFVGVPGTGSVSVPQITFEVLR
jgi:hypothetical protein